MSNWVYVCEAEDIDIEDILRFDHNQQTFCIYRLEDGFYATDGICTHESVHLEEGLVMDGEIECPMHQGIFDINTGKYTPLIALVQATNVNIVNSPLLDFANSNIKSLKVIQSIS